MQLRRRYSGRRFIPTHVGNTPLGGSLVLPSRVHPHARGEHTPTSVPSGCSNGSSPRTWGTHNLAGLDHCVARFIPTHVGNTSRSAATPGRGAVHPHARGEHSGAGCASPRSRGSSPRTWGTRPAGGPHRAVQRFIPTHVGNTCDERRAPSAAAVHPHARGEHHRRRRQRHGRSGSSPRTWGTRNKRDPRVAYVRFIPTHVGNTRCSGCRFRRRTVHPHARGEHALAGFKAPERTGSSPRTWGTLGFRRCPGLSCRFIPTHVGNTAVVALLDGPSAVHPHARGEHRHSR